jgi:AraC family transcriptional activator of pobA
VRRFRALVEAQYREQPSLAMLAARLGITTTQLNRVCREVLGRPALAVVHTRLVLEAQRELAYTSMSVKQVALGLGFEDAAYFSRFFQRRTGQTPTAWRAAAHDHSAPSPADPRRSTR